MNMNPEAKYSLLKNPIGLVTLCLVLVGLMTRLTMLYHDSLDVDGYTLMFDVEKSFGEYTKTISAVALPERIHYWLTFRLHGGELYHYLWWPIAANLLTIVTFYVGGRIYFNNYYYWIFFTLGLLIFNGHATYLASYSMFDYSFSLLMSSYLYFLFIHFSQNIRANIKWYWIPIAIVPAAFFSNLTMTVPVIMGIVSVYVYRIYKYPETRNAQSAWSYLKSLWGLFLIPVCYFVIYTLQPLTNMGSKLRPDMDPYFFTSSSYEDGGISAMKFLSNNSIQLFGELTRPLNLSLVIAAMLLAVLIVYVLYKKGRQGSAYLSFLKKDTPVLFTLIYISTIFCVIAVGGLLGLYPFGTVRYTSYLLPPVLTMLGYFCWWSSNNIVQLLGMGKFYGRSMGVFSIIFLVVAFTAAVYRFNLIKENRSNLYALINKIDYQSIDLVLLGEYPARAIRHFKPDVYHGEKTVNIGWGTFWGHGNDGGIPISLSDKLNDNTVDRVLVIAASEDQFESIYPSYSRELKMRFKYAYNLSPVFSLGKSPKVLWAAVYIKK